jgi:hypothetical protein
MSEGFAHMGLRAVLLATAVGLAAAFSAPACGLRATSLSGVNRWQRKFSPLRNAITCCLLACTVSDKIGGGAYAY